MGRAYFEYIGSYIEGMYSWRLPHLPVYSLTYHPKVQRTRHAVNAFRTGEIKSIGHRATNAPQPPEEPPREDAIAKNTVDPRKMARRKNRAVMLHALANIEQWA